MVLRHLAYFSISTLSTRTPNTLRVASLLSANHTTSFSPAPFTENSIQQIRTVFIPPHLPFEHEPPSEEFCGCKGVPWYEQCRKPFILMISNVYCIGAFGILGWLSLVMYREFRHPLLLAQLGLVVLCGLFSTPVVWDDLRNNYKYMMCKNRKK